MMFVAFFSLVVGAATIQIPSIADVSLMSTYPMNTTTLTNMTCEQCLCSNIKINAVAINCFESNQTCQYFSSFPRTYRIQSTSPARLYFPQQSFPPTSRCCAANLTDLINRFANATMTSASVSGPRCLAVDQRFQYIVTAQFLGTVVSRFHLRNLTLVDQTSYFGAGFYTIVYFQGCYYVGRSDQTILVINSSTLAVANTISSTNMRNPRDIMFLQNGQILVATSTENNNLIFYNRSMNSATQYSYIYDRPVSYQWPHGLLSVNDSFFYATSWDRDSVFTYSANNNGSWTESLFINASSSGGYKGGSHIFIDECQRIWFTIYNVGVMIYNERGSFLGNFSRLTSALFDMIFVDNYVMYLSDSGNNRIIRLDPQITC